SYDIPKPDGEGTRNLSLDGRIQLKDVDDKTKRKRIESWMNKTASGLGVDSKIQSDLRGIVFEVRQGYKSKDAKRQNADIANAATAYSKAYLPCLVVFSGQIDNDLLMRYRTVRWASLVGTIGANDPMNSTYDFMRDVVGYDLAAFFQRNSGQL